MSPSMFDGIHYPSFKPTQTSEITNMPADLLKSNNDSKQSHKKSEIRSDKEVKTVSEKDSQILDRNPLLCKPLSDSNHTINKFDVLDQGNQKYINVVNNLSKNNEVKICHEEKSKSIEVLTKDIKTNYGSIGENYMTSGNYTFLKKRSNINLKQADMQKSIKCIPESLTRWVSEEELYAFEKELLTQIRETEKVSEISIEKEPLSHQERSESIQKPNETNETFASIKNVKEVTLVEPDSQEYSCSGNDDGQHPENGVDELNKLFPLNCRGKLVRIFNLYFKMFFRIRKYVLFRSSMLF